MRKFPRVGLWLSCRRNFVDASEGAGSGASEEEGVAGVEETFERSVSVFSSRIPFGEAEPEGRPSVGAASSQSEWSNDPKDS